MGLDVDTPQPPDLTNRGVPREFEGVESVGAGDDLYRGELETALREGAWREAFAEWSAYTDLSEAEYRAALSADLVSALDFYWDPKDERLTHAVPRVPDAVTEAEGVDGDARSRIERALDELGRTVVELLEEYLESAESDVVWSVETFGHGIHDERPGE